MHRLTNILPFHWLKWDNANRTCTCACGHVKITSAPAFHQNRGPHVVSNMFIHSEVALLVVLGVFELSEHWILCVVYQLALRKLEVALDECSQLRCSGKEEASEWNEVQGRFPLLYALWNRAISQIWQARSNQESNPSEPKFLSDRHPRWLTSIPSRNLPRARWCFFDVGPVDTKQ